MPAHTGWRRSHRSRLGRRATVIGVCLLLMAPATSAITATATDAPHIATCARDPFVGGLADHLADTYPSNRFTAEVLDLDDGCRYSLNRDQRQSTASVIKVAIMAAALLRAQDEDRALTPREDAWIAPMIASSDDPAASALWVNLGGAAGIKSYLDRFDLTETTLVEPAWGASITSAADQVKLIEAITLGPGPLTPQNREVARAYLLSVVPAQQWGITAGVPASWPVPMKNGFFDSRAWDWRINSVGVVEGPGRSGWVVAILSDGWPSAEPGIEAVEVLSESVAYHLLRRDPARHPFIDVPEASYYEAHVARLADAGIVEGRSPIQFDPHSPVTRAQFASLLYRLAGSPPVPAGPGRLAFSDVAVGSVHHDAVLWMATEAITVGVEPGRFGPDRLLTRSQAATFLYRFAGTPAVTGDSRFADVDTRSQFADAVTWMVETGVSTGVTPETFEPHGVVTRARAAAFLGRMLNGS